MNENNTDDDSLLDNHIITSLPRHENNTDQSTDKLNEWFIWSYLNVLLGGVIFGLIAIGCSLRTYKFKKRQNYSKAFKWSYITLFINILSTLTGLTYLGYLIYMILSKE